ncbi:tetratricopeptide repeat protein [Zhouia sp. PK063]|uniref:tetratricopeptide repeat protein n=1 Tax=Zhouia sp. PK063 TaxID=3373602 RepID=UPI00379A7655
MKTLIVIIVSFICSTTSFAQSKYEKGMEKGLALFKEQKINEASNVFERIASTEQDNWIPYYYEAYVNVIASFGEKDETAITNKLKIAEKSLLKAAKISPNNPEIMVLQALQKTAWIAFDGATYAMQYAPEITALYQKANTIAPNNPRVVYSLAEWNMGSARYFGKDITPFCGDLEQALKLFATFKNDTAFYPSWGEDRTKQLLTDCKK